MNQNQAEREGSLGSERIATLDRELPGWRGKTFGRQWQEGIRAAAAFRNENGRDARQTGTGVPEDEGRIGWWIVRQRQADRADKLSVIRRDALDRELPGWQSEDLDVVWHRHLAEAVEFYGTHEQKIDQWTREQRRLNRHSKLPEGRLSALDRELPGWRGHDRDQVWQDNLLAAAAFHAEYGRHARGPNPGVPAAEGKAGMWLHVQREAEKNGRLTEDRLEVLDRDLPGWRGQDRDQIWADNLAAVVAFRAEHGRYARRTSPGVSDEGARLNRWLSEQRFVAKRGQLRADRLAALNTELPGWRGQSAQ